MAGVDFDVALEVLSVARGACGHWARVVVLDERDGKPHQLALTCVDGVSRFVSAEQVMGVDASRVKARAGVERVTSRVADELVQLAVFDDVRYPV